MDMPLSKHLSQIPRTRVYSIQPNVLLFFIPKLARLIMCFVRTGEDDLEAVRSKASHPLNIIA